MEEDLEEVLEKEVVGDLKEEEQVKLGAQPLLLPPLLLYRSTPAADL